MRIDRSDRTFSILGCMFCLCLLVIGCTVSNNGIRFEFPKRTTKPKPVIVKPSEKIADHGLRALFLEDVEARKGMTPTQRSMWMARDVRSFLKEHCIKDADGNPEFRFLDGTPSSLKKLNGVWSELAGKYPADSLPWMILQNGSAVLSKPYPKGWDELKADLDKYAAVE